MTEKMMRNFIVLAEGLDGAYFEDEPVMTSPVVEVEQPSAALLHDLGDIAFRLRSFMESEGGEYALGVETGMQRAADMIENVIRRYRQGDDHIE